MLLVWSVLKKRRRKKTVYLFILLMFISILSIGSCHLTYFTMRVNATDSFLFLFQTKWSVWCFEQKLLSYSICFKQSSWCSSFSPSYRVSHKSGSQIHLLKYWKDISIKVFFYITLQEKQTFQTKMFTHLQTAFTVKERIDSFTPSRSAANPPSCAVRV